MVSSASFTCGGFHCIASALLLLFCALQYSCLCSTQLLSSAMLLLVLSAAWTEHGRRLVTQRLPTIMLITAHALTIWPITIFAIWVIFVNLNHYIFAFGSKDANMYNICLLSWNNCSLLIEHWLEQCLSHCHYLGFSFSCYLGQYLCAKMGYMNMSAYHNFDNCCSHYSAHYCICPARYNR